MKPLHWHPLARLDADEAAAWYAEQGGLTLELAFANALESATTRIAQHPGAGSFRYADMLKINGLRFWPTRNFPYLIFYLERDAQIDIWRVLHAERDIPAWMGDARTV